MKKIKITESQKNMLESKAAAKLKEDISYSKEEAGLTGGSLSTTKTVIMKDERSEGDLIINILALNLPSEAGSNGFPQPGFDELNALNLLLNKKNLKVHSSRGAWLQMYEDFMVTTGNTIQLIGLIADGGGALEGEVFTIYATPVQSTFAEAQLVLMRLFE